VRVRDVYLFACAFHSLRIVQCTHAKFEGLRIFNHVIQNNDGFHFVSSEHVHVSNCTVVCQDDACALFGSCKFVTVTNCTFSTRWSIFRFGGGQAENIVVSNCIIYETYGCPIKLHCSPNSRFENMSFSNLIMKDVTGPIYIGAGPGRRNGETTEPRPPGIVRNISFSNIRGNVVAEVKQYPDVPFSSHINPGEERSSIVLTASGGAIVENISFSDVHFTFEGGGTAEEAAKRDLPQVAGEYFSIGAHPAYAFYARNVRGLSLSDVRFEVSKTDVRPAMIFDHVQDATVNGLSAQADKGAESAVRFISTKDVLMSATRVLTPTPVFLQVEGADSAGITIDGGDVSKAEKTVVATEGALPTAVKLRV
jgi:polygalacturonase